MIGVGVGNGYPNASAESDHLVQLRSVMKADDRDRNGENISRGSLQKLNMMQEIFTISLFERLELSERPFY